MERLRRFWRDERCPVALAVWGIPAFAFLMFVPDFVPGKAGWFLQDLASVVYLPVAGVVFWTACAGRSAFAFALSWALPLAAFTAVAEFVLGSPLRTPAILGTTAFMLLMTLSDRVAHWWYRTVYRRLTLTARELGRS